MKLLALRAIEGIASQVCFHLYLNNPENNYDHQRWNELSEYLSHWTGHPHFQSGFTIQMVPEFTRLKSVKHELSSQSS